MIKLTISAALLVLLMPSISGALGMGDIEVDSALNQPLKAQIKLLSTAANELKNVKATLASQEAFDRVGVERSFLLNQLKFDAVMSHGKPVISVTTKQPVKEPFVNFLMEIKWPEGRLLREYTVLLDPPVLEGRKAAITMQTPVVAQPLVAEPTSASASDTVQSKPVHSPSVAHTKIVEATEPNSQAPSSANSTDIPSEAEAKTYKVQPGDTLGKITQANLPGSNRVTLQQMMIALLRANPDAFVEQNINILKSGYILQIPSESEVAAVNGSEAFAEVKKQYSSWKKSRTPPVESSVEPLADTEDASAVSSSSQASNLEILSTPEDNISDGNTVLKFKQDAALAQELAESRLQENEALKAKIEELENLTYKQEHVINLQNDELSDFQKRLEALAEGDRAIESPAESASPGTAEIESGVVGDFESGSADQELLTPESPEPNEGSVAAEAELSEQETIEPQQGLPATQEPSGVESEAMDTVAGVTGDTELVTDSSSEQFQQQAVVEETVVESESLTAMMKGWLNKLKGNPIWMGIAGASALILALILMLISRSRKKPEDANEFGVTDIKTSSLKSIDSMQPVTDDESTAISAESDQADVAVAVSDATVGVEKSKSLHSEGELPDFTAGLADDEPQQDLAVDEVLSEADVYIAYGLHGQAIDLLKEALQKDPSRQDYRAKLLEAYHGEKNKDEFEVLASELYESTGGQGKYWERAVAMGKEISPMSPLFVAEKADSSDVEIDHKKPESDVQLNNTALEGLEFDIDNEVGVTPPDVSLDETELTGTDDIRGISTESSTEGEGTKFDETKSLDLGVDIFDMENAGSGLEAGEDGLLEFEIDDLGESSDSSSVKLDGGELEFDLGDIEPNLVADIEDEDSKGARTTDILDEDKTAGLEIPEDLADVFDRMDKPKVDEEGMSTELYANEGLSENDATVAPETYAEQGFLGSDTAEIHTDNGFLGTEQIEVGKDATVLLENELGDPFVDGLDDESGTKLDLAKAYMDMGDSEGARSALEEVMQEGDTNQKKEAEELLKKIA